MAQTSLRQRLQPGLGLPAVGLLVRRGRLDGLAARTALTLAACVAIAMLAPRADAAPALVAWVLSLCLIFLFPAIKKVPSHVWGAVVGGLAALVLPHLAKALRWTDVRGLGAATVLDELLGHLHVPVLILLFAYLSRSLEDSGFFNWASVRIIWLGGGDGRRLLLVLFLGVSLLTLFTSNDIVILSVTPILIHLARNAGIWNLTPFLMAQFVAANTASMGLYMGNPTNMVVSDAAGIGFLQYAQRMFLPTLVTVASALAVVWALFASPFAPQRVPLRYRVPKVAAVTWAPEMTVKVGAFVCCLLALGLSGTACARLARAHVVLGTVAVFVVGVALYDVSIRRGEGRGVFFQLRRLPLEIVPFFLSFCVILRGLEAVGLTRYAADAVVQAFSMGAFLGSLVSGFYAVLAVNLTNNIPATILFEKAWTSGVSFDGSVPSLAQRLGELHPSYPEIFLDNVLYASNFGANLTLIGALAGLMWFRLIREQRGMDRLRGPSAVAFMAYGLCIVPCVTVLTCTATAWLRTTFS